MPDIFFRAPDAALRPRLRDYQIDGIADVRRAFAEHQRVVLVAPTGAGKTVMFSSFAADAAAEGQSVVAVAHRSEIVDQISGTFAKFGIPHGIVGPVHPATDDAVQVAMVQSLTRRLERMPEPDWLILDEAHHCLAGTWRKVLDAWPNVRVLGVTATPERLDGRGLGDVFQAMVLAPTTAELIELGNLAAFTYLAPATEIDMKGVRTRGGDYATEDLAKAVDQSGITGDVVRHYRERLYPGQAIAFCVNRLHARHVAAMFLDDGIPAASIDGSMPREERAAILGRLRRGELLVLTSCELISEGFDVPSVAGAILLRPTASLGMYLQQVGRALRPKADGSRAVILDHVGNVGRHGLPDDPRAWDLGATKRKAKKAKVRQCEACGAVFAIDTKLKCAQTSPAPGCIAQVKAPSAAPPEIPLEQAGELVVQERRRERWPVSFFTVSVYEKPGGGTSLRVVFRLVNGTAASEFLAFESPHRYAKRISGDHWRKLSNHPDAPAPRTVAEAFKRQDELSCPAAIIVKPGDKWPSVVDIERRQPAPRPNSAFGAPVQAEARP